MLVHRLLVESVDLRCLGGSASGNDVLGDRFDRGQEAPGEKNLCSLARESARDSTADCPAGSVDHRGLVLQQHLWFPFTSDDARTIRAVMDADTTMSRNWARTLRPVCESTGVDTGEIVDR